MQKFSKIFQLPIGDIYTNKKLFQGRIEDFSQATYDKILREGFDTTQDPIIVWQDTNLNRYFVISGHSRLAAAQKLYNNGNEDLSVLPVKEFLGDLESAVAYATLESNRSGTAEGLLSDVKAYKSALKGGCNGECLKGYFKTQPYINTLQRLSYLSEKGKFIENLNDEVLSKQFARLQQIAEWTGELRKNYEQLTDKHENEIFDFIYDGKSQVPAKKEDFLKPIEKAVSSFLFDANKPLNLKNFVFKSVYQVQAENQEQMLSQEIEDLKSQNGVLQIKIARFREAGKNTDEPEAQLKANNELIIKKIGQIEKAKEYAKEATNQSLDLFAQPETTQENTKVDTEKETTKETEPKNISELVEWVTNNPTSNELKSVVYGKVTNKQAQEIEKATSINVLGFERVLDSYGIKHILKNHGKASEELRGQEPITLEDFKKIPDVVENYDKVFGGVLSKRNKLPMIAYIKRINGVILIVEEQRESKKKSTKRVPVLTMMKFKVGEKKSPEELMLSIQKAYTQDTSPTLTSETFSGHAKVTKKTKTTKETEPKNDLKVSISDRIKALQTSLKYATDEKKEELQNRIKNLETSLKYLKK